MAIRVTEEPDIYVSQDELNRYRDEYKQFCSYYCGTPPTLEAYIRQSRRGDHQSMPSMTAVGPDC